MSLTRLITVCILSVLFCSYGSSAACLPERLWHVPTGSAWANLTQKPGASKKRHGGNVKPVAIVGNETSTYLESVHLGCTPTAWPSSCIT